MAARVFSGEPKAEGRSLSAPTPELSSPRDGSFKIDAGGEPSEADGLIDSLPRRGEGALNASDEALKASAADGAGLPAANASAMLGALPTISSPIAEDFSENASENLAASEANAEAAGD